ncbi:hypothetical protein COV20_04030 [Candidatus Woesearchaeota archaeon CG10_big_fil_rev_8_21_14_0_10_45_16]|nr:MAG: hypothetical protein COV20_04030 [Candidatus Woesearchaeota archaeon CG10_big_fil_rev_8_21_14_0_10_45_16]
MNLKYLFFPLLAVLLSTGLYCSFAYNFSQFGAQGNHFVEVLHLYAEVPDGSILFVGDSQIREDVDCTVIEDLLKDSPPCFNLGVAGMRPFQVALQKDLIISARPSKVVIGITPASFDETINQNDDFFMLMSSSVTPSSYLLERLDSDELELISMNRFQRLLYKRKFILPYFLSFLHRSSSSEAVVPAGNNLKNPHQFEDIQSAEELEQKLQDPKVLGIFSFGDHPRREREAFAYLTASLKAEGIEVVVVQMPMNPITFNVVPADSLQQYNDYIQGLSEIIGFRLVNIETDFSAEYFTDLTHLNREGSRLLSERIARGEYDVI